MASFLRKNELFDAKAFLQKNNVIFLFKLTQKEMEETFEYIEIKKFRCFEDTKISGFEAVNLIGGKNNSGKTALLEALWLNAMPFASSIMLMQALRKEDESLARQFPEKAWENLFFNQQQDKEIFIKTNQDKEGIFLSVKIENETLKKSNNYILNEHLGTNSSASYFAKAILKIKSQSKVRYNNNNKISRVMNIPMEIPDFYEQFIQASSNGFDNKIVNRQNFNALDREKAMFIYAKKDSSPKVLAQSFDNNLNHYDDILKAFQIIDSSIIDARTFSTGSSNLMLKRKGGNYMPLALFGDAIYKMATIILSLLNGKKGNILLIDEIENGIHYTHHQKFWELLFELSNKFGIQIFATSHSLEMITAFNEVARKTNSEAKGKYFEMSRHAKTNKIVANAMNMDTLHYEIQKKHAFRGE